MPGPNTVLRVIKYVLTKTLLIAITIFLGVYGTVLLANQRGRIDETVRQEVLVKLNDRVPGWNWVYVSAFPTERRKMDVMKWDAEDIAGLHLDPLPRNLFWTFKALRIDWREPVKVISAPGSAYPGQLVSDILLTDLPHTLLLVGLSFFLLFVLGLPFALYLYRSQASRLDRFVTLLAPVSSIPSWVIVILLILIFAVNLKLLPPGGMLNSIPAETLWGRFLALARHAVLPVLAILLSLIFQFVNACRTYFLLFSTEDYVTLGLAKGLPTRWLETRYVLHPSLPYILTSFALTLVSFWQMTIALEKIVNWPGIGRLYILTLPNYWGESFFPGIPSITLGIVVLFAYLLGLTVFLLEIIYGLVDPRVRLGGGQTLQAVHVRTPFQMRLRLISWPRYQPPLPVKTGWHVPTAGAIPAHPLQGLRDTAQDLRRAVQPVLKEILRYPSALVGLIIILLLVIGSTVALVAFPYNQLGDAWSASALGGRVAMPRLAQPAWSNWFSRSQLPPTLRFSSLRTVSPQVTKTNTPTANGRFFTLTYTIDFPYNEFPQDVYIYFDPQYTAKAPFASLTWTTPDGRKINLGGQTALGGSRYSAAQDLPTRRLLLDNPLFTGWFQGYGNYPTSRVLLLFADPASVAPKALPGSYQLRLDAVTFDQSSSLDAELIIVGQVYGLAGTDYIRRDLLVPLLWGMPFALIYGLLGAFLTTLLALILAAATVWFGGWLDILIQQLIEANMILPVIAISVMIYSYFDVSIWTLLGIIILLNVFSSPTRSFRAAFLQIRKAPYIEAARAYGASHTRIIFRYMIPRIMPILVPQLVTLISSYVFLEATLSILNVKSEYPTWGRVIYEALRFGGSFGSSYWVLEPLALLLLTGLAFAMLGYALERVLNPTLKEK